MFALSNDSTGPRLASNGHGVNHRVSLFVSPAVSRGDTLGSLLRRLSSSTDAIEMKLHMWIELKWFKSHAQDP